MGNGDPCLEEMLVKARGTENTVSSLLFSSPALQQEILSQGGVMIGWVIYIARGIFACVRENLHKANVTSD